jgi:hypothetical protein
MGDDAGICTDVDVEDESVDGDTRLTAEASGRGTSADNEGEDTDGWTDCDTCDDCVNEGRETTGGTPGMDDCAAEEPKGEDMEGL